MKQSGVYIMKRIFIFLLILSFLFLFGLYIFDLKWFFDFHSSRVEEKDFRQYLVSLKGKQELVLAELETSEVITHEFGPYEAEVLKTYFIPIPGSGMTFRMEIPVTFYYAVELDHPWEIKMSQSKIDVFAPALIILNPAPDISGIKFETKGGWIRFDKKELHSKFFSQITPLLKQRAFETQNFQPAILMAETSLKNLVLNWVNQQNNSQFLGSIHVSFEEQNRYIKND